MLEPKVVGWCWWTKRDLDNVIFVYSNILRSMKACARVCVRAFILQNCKECCNPEFFFSSHFLICFALLPKLRYFCLIRFGKKRWPVFGTSPNIISILRGIRNTRAGTQFNREYYRKLCRGWSQQNVAAAQPSKPWMYDNVNRKIGKEIDASRSQNASKWSPSTVKQINGRLVLLNPS